MTTPTRFRAFVASTFEDLKAHRAHVISDLQRAGLDVDPMEIWTASIGEPKRFSIERVKDCHLCVLLVGFRRGHVPTGENRSITQMEYEAAKQQGCDRLVFLAREGSPWPRQFYDLDRDSELRTWRDDLSEGHGVEFFDFDPTSIHIAGALSFGTLFPQTGPMHYRLPQMEAGLQLAIKDIKDSGGIANIYADEVHRRDEGDPSTDDVCRSADALLAADVDVIIGPGLSANTLKVIDKVVGAGVILFSPANTADVLSNYSDDKLYFRTAPSNFLLGYVLGKLVVSDDGNRRAVVMSVNDVYGESLREETAKAIEKAGGRVVDSFPYNPSNQNFDHEVERVIVAKPHAVILLGFLADSAKILQTMISRGVGPKDKNVYGATNVGVILVLLVGQDRGALAGMKGVGAGVNEAFSDRLNQLEPSLQQDLTYAAETYDAVVITALAAEAARTDAPGEIAKKINDVTRDGEKCWRFAECKELLAEGKNIDYDGASGPLEFNEAGEPSST